MRLGGALFGKFSSPEKWAQAALRAGYRAVYFPVDYTASLRLIDGFVRAAQVADLVIAEVGVWNNPLDSDPEKREQNIQRAIRQLELADYVGARCCVNIAGSYAQQWDGPHPDNLTERGFEDIVRTTQRILDVVNPRHSVYTLEPMPYLYPDTADSYVRLLAAIDRPGFAAHLDPVNIISSPQKYYQNGDIIREWFDKLGPHIRSCHAKDIVLRSNLTVHLDECRPGTGGLDYRAYLTCLNQLDKDTPLMLEHMSTPEDYAQAAQYISAIARELGIAM
ncbi:MAG: sugar phosphate isomerase/epimerase family protein [Christensenellales bacterium]|jgi:sugar phosphate isomerase/epimerase